MAEAAPEEHEGHGVDPHVWLSVDNARVMVENVRDALIDLDGNNADYYRDNATRYLSTLDALDRDIQTQVQSIPAACRKLVTNHEVLGYFADAYGFELVGSVIPSTVTDAQPSAADVADIVRQRVVDRQRVGVEVEQPPDAANRGREVAPVDEPERGVDVVARVGQLDSAVPVRQVERPRVRRAVVALDARHCAFTEEVE